MPGEITAVNAGNIKRHQGRKRAGVVPVIEMAAISLQPPHRRQSLVGALQELPGRDVAEITG